MLSKAKAPIEDALALCLPIFPPLDVQEYAFGRKKWSSCTILESF